LWARLRRLVNPRVDQPREWLAAGDVAA
jgi:hypothetical protein